VVTLDFNAAARHSTATATKLFELFCEREELIFVSRRYATYYGHAFALASLGFAPNTHDAVTDRPRWLGGLAPFAPALSNGPGALGAGASLIGRVDDSLAVHQLTLREISSGFGFRNGTIAGQANGMADCDRLARDGRM
jgi:hypothetical protein